MFLYLYISVKTNQLSAEIISRVYNAMLKRRQALSGMLFKR